MYVIEGVSDTTSQNTTIYGDRVVWTEDDTDVVYRIGDDERAFDAQFYTTGANAPSLYTRAASQFSTAVTGRFNINIGFSYSVILTKSANVRYESAPNAYYTLPGDSTQYPLRGLDFNLLNTPFSGTTQTVNFTIDRFIDTAAHIGDLATFHLGTGYTAATYTASTASATFTTAADGGLTITLPLSEVNDPTDTAVDDGLYLLATYDRPVPAAGSHSVIYPADRCRWTVHQSPVDQRGYYVGNATFFDGASSTGTTINLPRFGYIGKSGRFVQIAR